MRIPRALSIALLAAICVTVVAHQEDPKARDRQPPYTGPGYRASAAGLPAGAAPFGAPGPSGPPVSFPSQGVTLMAWLPLPELDLLGVGLSNGNSCFGYVAPSGREYALIGHSGGTTIVEVTDPGDPDVIAMIAGPTSLWRDVRTYQSYAYAVSEGGGGIQVIDLSAVDSGVATLVTSVTTGGTAATHTVEIDPVSGYLYRCGGGANGLRIYSLANPALPVFVGSWSDRYVHEAQVVTYTSGPYAGKQVAFACGGLNGGWDLTGLDILDVTDKQNIVSFSQQIYPNGEYSHQGCLSPDRQYFYLDDELDEGTLGLPTTTFVFDVSTLATPVYLGTFTNGNNAIGHNLYTLGNLLFEANYRSGLRVFDATNPVSPFEIAYFDTYPDDDNKNYNGLWNVFPYFPSGTVIGSDIERGLFVWQVGDPPLSFSYPSGIPTEVEPDGDTLQVEITPEAGVVLDIATPTLWVDTGSGFAASPLVSLGGGTWEGTFPPSACGQAVPWYVAASPVVGAAVTDPSGAPASAYEALSRLGTTLIAEDTMESGVGWSVGVPGDTATSGIWSRGDPTGTATTLGAPVQPEDDHSAIGAACWATGLAGGAVGADDVDGGATTLVTPAYDLTDFVEPELSYWRWYSNNGGAAPGEDTLEVRISADGVNWVTAESVGPGGAETFGGWIHHRIRVSEHISPSATVRLRFVASDLLNGSVVEAAIDDLRIEDTICVDCNQNGVDDTSDIAEGTSTDFDSDGIPDECTGAGCPDPFIRGDANADGTIDLSDAVAILIYLFSAGPMPAPLDRADIDAGGVVNIADAVQVLGYLFDGGAAPAPPFPNQGCP